MKKKWNYPRGKFWIDIPLIMKIMKLVTLFLFVAVMHVAAATYSQTTRLTIVGQNLTIGVILDQIENQSEFSFFFNANQLDLSKRINIAADNQLVNKILDEILAGSGLTYTVNNKLIVIHKQEETGNVFGSQQTNRISGKVTDSSGFSLPGVSVVVKGTTNGTITDSNGNFSISNISENAILQFSFVGMKMQEVIVKSKTVINVTLEEESIGIEEVVAVGYGTQRKETLTGAISNINSKSILSTKNPNLIQNLQGKVAGLQIRQSNSMPGASTTSINIRGFGTPLFVIDGVLRDGAAEFQRIDPNDIESISVLKDGSAAIYGIGADNGVIIVTTKKGEKGKLTVSYSGNTGWSTPTNVPRMVSGSDWVDLKNEMRANVWNGTEYSIEETQKYKDGNLSGYESVNWYDETMKQFAARQQHNISFRGGTEASTYFVSLGDNKDGGLLKSDAINYNQINLRSNIMVNLAKGLSMNLNLSGRRENNDQVAGGFMGVFKGTVAAAPLQKPYINDDLDFPAYIASSSNPVALTRKDLAGYQAFLTNFTQSSIGLTYDIPYVKGLKIKGLVAYDYSFQSSKYLNRAIKFYTASPTTGEPVFANTANSNTISVVTNYNDRFSLQAQLLYNTTIAEDHNISATLLYEQRKGNSSMLKAQRNYDFYTVDVINQAGITNQTTDGSEGETANMSYVGRLNYDYAKKYLLEFAFRYDGTYRYNPDNRWGFFPYASIGWRVSEENFFKENLSFISNLKFRGSYGITGEDAGSPFQYVSGYRTGATTGYEFTEGLWTGNVLSPALVNRNLTWYKATTVDLGFDLDVLKGKLGFSFDLYQRDRTGLLAYRNGSLPNTFGATLPQENLNSDRVKGIELSVSHNNKIGKFSYGINANLNISQSMLLYIEQGPFQSTLSKWQNDKSYRNKNMIWGYEIIGQFESLDQIRNYPVFMDAGAGNSKQLPGDPIYKDVNGDGLIDSKDMTPMFWTGQTANGGSVDYSSGQPPLQYGINMNAAWNGIDINILLQGAANYTIRLGEAYQTPFYAQLNAPEYMMNRWHLEDPFNKDSKWIAGTLPATRDINSASSVHLENNLWRRDASYLRIKSLELGYTIPQIGLRKIKIDNLRIYVNGNNLFTFCDKLLKYFDPERGEGPYGAEYDYPLTKSYNLGLNVTF
jgi:TonB-linked SusC/RagA family outer membrane protein